MKRAAGFLVVAGALVMISCGKRAPAEPVEETELMQQIAKPAADTSVPEKKVLRSRLAGSWYPGTKNLLTASINGYLMKATGEQLEPVMALIMPHAGYEYSGQTAAYALRQIRNVRYKKVIVIGPSHRQPMRNYCSVPDATHYETPLGQVPLDLECIARLRSNPKYFQSVPDAHAWEHSVQIQVPLLQRMQKNFTLVPVIAGQLDDKATLAIAEILKEEMDNETLLVISSDFTHYGANYGYRPFTADIPANLEKLDMSVFEPILKKDMIGLYRKLDMTQATVCGRCPLGIMLAMLPENAEVHLLNYDTSGRITGDFSSSVSYIAAAVTGLWEPNKPPAGRQRAKAKTASETREALTAKDRQNLLKLARSAIEYYLEHKSAPAEAQLQIEITPGMKQTLGAFVTLKRGGDLRGCIGEIVPRREIYKAVIEQAVNAAVFDSRFPPVHRDELLLLSVEISALLPPRPVKSYSDIEIGKHGIVLKKGLRQAVFLPQVAPEQGWTLEETLSNLAIKAGLPADAWKKDAEFMVFEAIVFHEGDE